MYIESYATHPRELEEYDITFTNGKLLTVTLCKDEGDTVDFELPNAIRFQTTKKVGITVDGSEIPPQDITVFTRHILAIEKRKRTVQPLTAEQRAAWREAINQVVSKSTH